MDLNGYSNFLRCPNSLEKLYLVENEKELDSVNSSLKSGNLSFSPDFGTDIRVQGLLCSEGSKFRYPIIDGIPVLFPDSFLTEDGSKLSNRHENMTLSAEQRHQMEKFSVMHDRWYKKITEAQQRILRKHYYHRFKNRSILDVGNGGLPPREQLGDSIADQLTSFVAIDKSYAMLKRNGNWGNQILANAACMPFDSYSFDFVLANGVLHHLGLNHKENSFQIIGEFIKELLRVGRRGVVIMELVVPPIGELCERALLKIMKRMPTFVYSKFSLFRSIRTNGFKVTDVIEKKIYQMVNPFSIVPPILDLEWLRIPIFAIPYSFVFFLITRK